MIEPLSARSGSAFFPISKTAESTPLTTSGDKHLGPFFHEALGRSKVDRYWHRRLQLPI
jgi:hypothetical protein